jgi:ferredoxin-NADP reductase
LRRALLARGERDAALMLSGGTGRWQPFGPAQTDAMKRDYEEDLTWLHAGADGHATITGETGAGQTGNYPQAADIERGQHHDREKRTMG